MSLLSRQKNFEQYEWWGPKPNLLREWHSLMQLVVAGV